MKSPKSKVQSPKCKVQSAKCKVQSAKCAVVAAALMVAVGHVALAQDQRPPIGNQQSAISNHQSLAPPTISQTISVSDAVEIALKNSPKTQAQRAEAEAARARIGMARAMTRPQVLATTFATTGTMPSIIPGPPTVEPQPFAMVPDKSQLDKNLMAMYPLYTGGRLAGQVRSAQSLYGAAASDARSAELDVALDARVAYRRVLLARRFVEAYQRRVDESRERLRIADESFKEGRIAKYDLLRNQTELADAEQALVNAERDADVAMVDLKTVLGVSQSSDLTLSGELAFEPVEGDAEQVQARAFRQRPEIAAARSRTESAQAGVDVARSAYRPQLYAVGMQDFALSSGTSGLDHGFIVGITAALPILDGGLRKSAVSEAKAMQDRTEAEERSAVLAVNRDVGTAWTELQAAAKNVKLAQAAVEQAEEDYRVVKLRYEAGKAINVEVLDALASMTNAQTNYAQALYEHSTAHDRLNRAVGDAS